MGVIRVKEVNRGNRKKRQHKEIEANLKKLSNWISFHAT